jgi:protein transport protein SEC24
MPSFGPGSIKNREDPKIFGTEKEKSLFLSQNDFYKNLAFDCARKGVCVDQFLFPSSYIDVATLGKFSLRFKYIQGVH